VTTVRLLSEHWQGFIGRVIDEIPDWDYTVVRIQTTDGHDLDLCLYDHEFEVLADGHTC
jgi:hypothetical protein